MRTPNFIESDLAAAESRVRRDREEISRALSELKSGARDTAKPYGIAAVGIIGAYLMVKFANRYL